MQSLMRRAACATAHGLANSLPLKPARQDAEVAAFERDSFEAVLDYRPGDLGHGWRRLRLHPNVRVASIENGAVWAAPLLHRLARAYGQMPQAISSGLAPRIHALPISGLSGGPAFMDGRDKPDHDVHWRGAHFGPTGHPTDN